MKRRPALANITALLFETLGFSIQPPMKVEVGFQVADEQRQRRGRAYDGRVVRVEGQLYVV
jgi:hypothetical protein